ncbi:MAG: hypothetical protein ACI33P_07020 [Lysinibacillus sp.]
MKHSLIVIIAVLIAGAVNALRFSYFSINTIHSMLPLLVIGLIAVWLYSKKSKEHAIYMTSILALFILALFGSIFGELDEITVEVAAGYVLRIYIVFTVTMICLSGALWYGYNHYIIKGPR